MAIYVRLCLQRRRSRDRDSNNGFLALETVLLLNHIIFVTDDDPKLGLEMAAAAAGVANFTCNTTAQ